MQNSLTKLARLTVNDKQHKYTVVQRQLNLSKLLKLEKSLIKEDFDARNRLQNHVHYGVEAFTGDSMGPG